MSACSDHGSNGESLAELEQRLRSRLRASAGVVVGSDGAGRVRQLARRAARRRTAVLMLAFCLAAIGVGLMILAKR